jgi:hypothetical protein
MARCKHGIFLPENPKYKAEDVCSMCFSLSETANHYVNSPNSDLEAMYQTGVDTDDTGLIRTISLIQMDRHTKQHIDDPIEQEFDAANHIPKDGHGIKVDLLDTVEFMQQAYVLQLFENESRTVARRMGNLLQEDNTDEIE